MHACVDIRIGRSAGVEERKDGKEEHEACYVLWLLDECGRRGVVAAYVIHTRVQRGCGEALQSTVVSHMASSARKDNRFASSTHSADTFHKDLLRSTMANHELGHDLEDLVSDRFSPGSAGASQAREESHILMQDAL